ncbi:MAG TPA: hypothetical protein PLV92_02935 [Pirellulaceae bacterium]|nr:hypothetical protein [Pirellulaceae bacterium]
MQESVNSNSADSSSRLFPALAPGVASVLDAIRDKASRAKVGETDAREKLRQGTKILVARSIWQRFKEYFQGVFRQHDLKQQLIATSLNCEPGAVSRGLNEGQLSLDSLSAFMTHLKWNWRDLGDLPSPESRARAGYIAALQFVREAIAKHDAIRDKTKRGRPLTPHALDDLVRLTTVDFICLVQLFCSRAWLKRDAAKKDADAVVTELRNVVKATLSERRSSFHPLELSFQDWERELTRLETTPNDELYVRFEKLHDDWGLSYVITVTLLDPAWEI